MSLNPHYKLLDFYKKIEDIRNPEKERIQLQNIRRLLSRKQESGIEVSSLQKEAFDYAYIGISKKESPEYAIKSFKHFMHNGNYRIFTRTNNIRGLLINTGITPEIMREMIYEEQKNALINASLETMQKYDVAQVGRALFGIKNGNYEFFTNTNNARKNLKLMIEPSEIDGIIKTILEEEGYKEIEDNDCYWVLLELIKKMNEEKTK